MYLPATHGNEWPISFLKNQSISIPHLIEIGAAVYLLKRNRLSYFRIFNIRMNNWLHHHHVKINCATKPSITIHRIKQLSQLTSLKNCWLTKVTLTAEQPRHHTKTHTFLITMFPIVHTSSQIIEELRMLRWYWQC